MQDCLKGGLEVKKSKFVCYAHFNYRTFFITSPKLLFFSSYWDEEATIGGELLNRRAFILGAIAV